MDGDYDRLVPDYDVYRTRKIEGEERSVQGPVELAAGDNPAKRSG
jgi:hypothetical protein